jgi:predicted nucleotidyltransferase component of viral defense system
VSQLDPFQAEVARVALRAARQHGFALAGSNALAVHGIIARPTEDVDLFTDNDHGVDTVAGHVAQALTAAGFDVRAVQMTDDLSDIFEGFSRDMAEYEVSRSGRTVQLQLVRFDRSHSPVLMDIGPVLHLEDLLASKVAALATRAEPRDYIDVAGALRRFSRGQLIDLARHADPGLSDEEFSDAMQRLDRLDDTVFTSQYKLTMKQVRALRDAFSAWPR